MSASTPSTPVGSSRPEQATPNAAASAGLDGTWRGRTQGHWWLFGGGVAAAVVLLVLGVFLTPAEAGVGTHEQLGLPACSTMRWFDTPCPGCGVTTSVTLAAQGRVAESIANQPFGFLVAVLLGGLVAFAAFGAIARRDLYHDLTALPARPKVLALSIGAVALASWVYKILLIRGAL